MINLNINSDNYLDTYPYPHCSIDNILPIDLAKKCQDEILEIPDIEWDRYNNPFEQKYTLRNKNKLPKNCTILFNYLNSKKFIEQLSDIVNQKLYADPTKNWWGVHKYDNGDHLDIHSDAGIHPKTKQKKHTTLGIYLSKNWSDENLGHLEIWEGDSINSKNHKLNKCVNKILPSFNKLILFNNTNNAWHGNPTPTKCSKDQKRIFVTVSYLSNNHENEYSNKHQKALFIKLPDEPENKEKDKLRLLRVDPEKYKEIYNCQ